MLQRILTCFFPYFNCSCVRDAWIDQFVWIPFLFSRQISYPVPLLQSNFLLPCKAWTGNISLKPCLQSSLDIRAALLSQLSNKTKPAVPLFSSPELMLSGPTHSPAEEVELEQVLQLTQYQGSMHRDEPSLPRSPWSITAPDLPRWWHHPWARDQTGWLDLMEEKELLHAGFPSKPGRTGTR